MSEPDELLGRTVGGRFRVVSLLGEGGMAKVYVAEQEGSPSKVALKIMNPSLTSDRSFVKRFEREANAASRVKHPGSAQILAYGVAEELSYIAMELLEGEDLFAILAREGRLGQQRAARIVKEIAEALASAHEIGIVHRDLKPENVMIVPDALAPTGERVKVLDFGIAKLMAPEENQLDPRAEPSPATGITLGHTLVGTPAYMSPEQAAMDRVDGRADVYACGVLLFQIITGKLPFSGETPLHVAQKHLREAVPLPSERVPGIDPSLEKIILKALQKKPADRFPTAMIFARTLNELVPRLPREPASTTKKRPSTSGEPVLAPPRPASTAPPAGAAPALKRPPPRTLPAREAASQAEPTTKPFGSPIAAQELRAAAAARASSGIKETLRGTGVVPSAARTPPAPPPPREPEPEPLDEDEDSTTDDTPTGVAGSDPADRARTLVRQVPHDAGRVEERREPRLGPQGTTVMGLTPEQIAALAPSAELAEAMRPPARPPLDELRVSPTLLSAGGGQARHVVAPAPESKDIIGDEATRPSHDLLLDRGALPSLDTPVSAPGMPSTQGSIHVVPRTGPSPAVSDLPRVVLSPPAPPPPAPKPPIDVTLPMPPKTEDPFAAQGGQRGPRTLELRQKPPVLEPFRMARPSMSAKRGLFIGFASGVVVAIIAFFVYWFVLRLR